MIADARGSIWDAGTRTDHAPRQAAERPFKFFNRLAGPRGKAFRGLLDAWVAQYPTLHRRDIVGRLRSDEVQFEGAFWELYLHEVFRRAGYDVVVHPTAPASCRQPDFRVTGEQSSFYLEARLIERKPTDMGRAARIEQVYDVLRNMVVDHPFVLYVGHARVGAGALPTKRLRRFIMGWLASLDHAKSLKQYGRVGVTGTPPRTWSHDDWEFELIAIPLTDERPGPHSVLRMWGPARGSTIHNDQVIFDALLDKAGAYGDLDQPLVIALLCNTRFPTEPHHVERALYGLHLPHPPDGIPDPETLQVRGDGFWVTSTGWVRREVPLVITAAGLGVVGVSRLDAHPVVWPHPDSAVEAPPHPPCFATATLGPLDFDAPRVEPAEFLDLPEELLPA